MGKVIIVPVSKYKEEFPKMLIKAFDIEPFKEYTLPNKQGGVFITKRVANPTPWFAKVAYEKFKVSVRTYNDWLKAKDENEAPRYPLLIEAHEIAKGLQEYIIAINAFLGLYNAQFSIFTLKNVAGWRDRQDVHHEGSLSVDSLMQTVAKDSKEKSMINKD